MTTTPPTEQANQMPPCPWGHTNIMRTPAGEVFCGYGTCPIYLVKIDPAKWSRRSAAEGQAALTDREQWLLADVSSIGRMKIDAFQYDELRALARRLAGKRIDSPNCAARAARVLCN